MLLQSLLRPVLTPLMRGMFDAPIASSSAWSPLALWPDGIATPGMWISPRDLESQWADYTGTTPVSVPGTVADSSNPVGLALDIRAGAPEVLGPELVTTPVIMEAVWTNNGGRSFSCNGSGYLAFTGAVVGKAYFIECVATGVSAGSLVTNIDHAWDLVTSANGTTTTILFASSGGAGISLFGSGFVGTVTLSVREVPGLHMLQSTSAARPLLSARVNLLTYTDDFSNAVWWTGGTTVSTNTGVAPDGTTTADTLIADATTGDHRRIQTSAGKGYADGVASFYVKAKEYGFAFIGLTESNATLYKGALVDLSNGAVVSNSANSVEVVDVGSGWYRVSVQETSIDIDFYALVAPVPSASVTIGPFGPSFTGDGTSGIYVWGGQVEFGTAATDYQSVPGDGSTYASGPPIAQLYDGVDDGMATAAFAAGTLIDGMDCMIAVRRDSAANVMAGIHATTITSEYTGLAVSGAVYSSVDAAGAPTVWVDGVQLTGGTTVTAGTLHTALTVGDWHILEYRNLDLSGAGWTMVRFSQYNTLLLNGARGDIMLYPSTTPTEDKDAARQWLADYYGVTLP